MATEDELARANARISELERGENERAKTASIVREVGRYELVDSAAVQQLTDLISPDVQMTTVTGGRQLIHDKDYKPLETIVSERLKSPQYAHFLKANQAAAPPAQAATPAVSTAKPLPPGQTLGAVLGVGARQEPLPGESLGAAMVRAAQTQRAAQGDPRLDPSQAMGIGRRPLTPK